MIAFVRGTTLMPRHLDLNRGELMGDPVRVADPVDTGALGSGGFQCRPMDGWRTVAAEEDCGN